MKRLILTLAAIAAVSGPIAASATEVQAQSYLSDRWDRREYGRDHRRDWDRGRHNGYYYGDRWNYGPPPQAYYGNPYYRPGYHQWRRGSSLPAYYRSAPVYEHGRYRLRQPPRGYAWYHAGNDYVLATIATGIIFEIINN